MPTYDYECDNGHRFEVFQSMKDDPLKECRECGAPVKRLIGPGAGFLFKGDGFYITDYRSKDYHKKAKAESSGGSDASSSKGSTDSGTSGDSGKGSKDGSSKGDKK
jgi:putative FmdB family regulatory protein